MDEEVKSVEFTNYYFGAKIGILTQTKIKLAPNSCYPEKAL